MGSSGQVLPADAPGASTRRKDAATSGARRGRPSWNAASPRRWKV
jgi:hypothetical protein